MTRQEALKEARRRWGDLAAVTQSFVGYTRDGSKPGVRVFRVGTWPLHLVGTIGRGDSWESAFADAERRQKEDGR